MDVSGDQLKQAVEGQHGGKAVMVAAEPVKEVFNGQTVWEGLVHVFDLKGHPKATRAYAWSSLIEGRDKRRFNAVFVPRRHQTASRCGAGRYRGEEARSQMRWSFLVALTI